MIQARDACIAHSFPRWHDRSVSVGVLAGRLNLPLPRRNRAGDCESSGWIVNVRRR
jgi:hypothetical protein